MTTTMPTDHEAAAVPDLTTYRHVHRALRVANENLVAALGDIVTPDTDRAAALSRWFVGYSGELRAHHEIEDELFFPAVAERVPNFAEHAASLDDDHHRLDELIDTLRDSLARLVREPQVWAATRTEAQATAVALHELMEAHLDAEDRDVLPMLERHFTAEEYAALDAKALKQVGIRQALFTVPWWMATAEPEAAARTLREAPMPLKVIYRLTRGRYAALAERAFGPAAVTQPALGGRS